MPNTAPPTPEGTVEEGTAQPRNKGGRPPRKPPINSILRVIKGMEDMAKETGNVDPSLASKLLAGYTGIVLERGLLADEKDIPLAKKVDWALRIAPVVAMFQALIPKDTGKAYPKTEVAIEGEIQRGLDKINKLLAKNAEVPPEVVLDALAPQAKATAEEV